MRGREGAYWYMGCSARAHSVTNFLIWAPIGWRDFVSLYIKSSERVHCATNFLAAQATSKLMPPFLSLNAETIFLYFKGPWPLKMA